MSDLASTTQLGTLLGLTPQEATDQASLLDLLLNQAEDVFEATTHRTQIPFTAALTDRTEVQDGSLSRRLWLDYPVASVTAVSLGDHLGPPAAEVLDVSNPAVLMIRAGSRELVRTDGGRWIAAGRVTQYDSLAFVQVTYTTEADLPGDATAAVLNFAAMLYSGLGTSGVQSESLDNYAVTYASRTDLAATVPGWDLAASAHRRLAVL